MNRDIIPISDEEAQLQCEMTDIALGVLENGGSSELVDFLNSALESGNFEIMRALKQIFAALPEGMRRCLLHGLGPPEQAQQATLLVEDILHHISEGEQVIIC